MHCAARRLIPRSAACKAGAASAGRAGEANATSKTACALRESPAPIVKTPTTGIVHPDAQRRSVRTQSALQKARPVHFQSIAPLTLSAGSAQDPSQATTHVHARPQSARTSAHLLRGTCCSQEVKTAAGRGAALLKVSIAYACLLHGGFAQPLQDAPRPAAALQAQLQQRCSPLRTALSRPGSPQVHRAV